MGWDAPKKARYEIVPVEFVADREEDVNNSCLSGVTAQVIDMNAVLRQYSFMVGTVTLATVVHRFIFHYIKTVPQLEIVFFCWDNVENHLEERFLFYEKTRYPVATGPPRPGYVISEEDGREHKENEQPMTEEEIANMHINGPPGGSWVRAMKSKKSKQRTWELMADVLRDKMGKQYPHILCLFGYQDGTIKTDPVGIDVDMVHKYHDRWGEADQRILHMALLLKETYAKVLISTNDNDMNLQVLSFDTQNIVIRQLDYYTIEHYEDEQYYSKAVAKNAMKVANIDSTIIRLFQVVDCTKLMQMYPDWNMRLSVQFMAFAINGVDYCQGLGKFGVPPAVCLNIIYGLRKKKLCPFVTITGQRLTRVITLHVNDYLTAVVKNDYKKVTKKNRLIYDDIDAYSTYIQRIMFCLIYFSGFDSGRTPPGPELRTDKIFHSADEKITTTNLYSKKYPQADCIFVDMYPETKLRIHPSINYPPDMAVTLLTEYKAMVDAQADMGTSSSVSEQESGSGTPTLFDESDNSVSIDPKQLVPTTTPTDIHDAHSTIEDADISNHKNHETATLMTVKTERTIAINAKGSTVLCEETLRLHNKVTTDTDNKHRRVTEYTQIQQKKRRTTQTNSTQSNSSHDKNTKVKNIVLHTNEDKESMSGGSSSNSEDGRTKYSYRSSGSGSVDGSSTIKSYKSSEQSSSNT